MIITTDAEKPLTNSESFHDKSAGETRKRRNVPQCNKGYIKQTYSQHHTKWGKN
jgi:hypothetical protein